MFSHIESPLLKSQFSHLAFLPAGGKELLNIQLQDLWLPAKIPLILVSGYDIHACSAVFSSLLRLHGLQPSQPLSMGFSGQEYWSRLPFPTPWDLSDPGIEPGKPSSWLDQLIISPVSS